MLERGVLKHHVGDLPIARHGVDVLKPPSDIVVILRDLGQELLVL